MMRGKFTAASGAALCVALASWGYDASAQTLPSAPAPPVFRSVDQNGVDLITGLLSLSETQASVGPQGSGGLARIYQGTGLRDNFSGAMSIAGIGSTGASLFTISLGSGSVQFTQDTSTSPFVPARGAEGGSLSFDGATTYTYTTSDGTKFAFSWAISSKTVYATNAGLLTSVTRPNLEKLTIFYSDFSACGTNPNGCKRPQAVRSSLGYMIKYDYQGAKDAPGNLDLAKVTAINLAVEYCDPTAASCSLSVVWPSMTFTGKASGTGTMTATDSLSRTTTYTFVNNQITKIQSPAGVVTNYTYDTNGRVKTVANSAGTWQYDYTLPLEAVTTVTDPNGNTYSVGSEFTDQFVTSTVDGVGNRTTYVPSSIKGKPSSIIYPEGNHDDFTYDARGNVTSVTKVAKPGSSLPNHVTTASYDATCANPKTCNQPNSIVDGGVQTDFTYDPNHGGVLNVTEPAAVNGGTRPQTRYRYTAFSASYLTSPGTVTTPTNPLYELTSVSQCKTLASCAGGADEIKATLAYAAANNAAAPGANNLQTSSVVSGSGDGVLAATTSYTYNAVGDQRTVTGPLGAAQSVRYRRDNYRQVIGIVGVDPDAASSGRPSVAQQINYNADGQVTSVVTGTVNSQSDADWAAFAAAQTTTSGYDSLGRKVSEQVSAAGTIQALTQFSYDSANRLQCTAVRMNPAVFSAPPASACTPGTVGPDGPDRISQTVYDNANRVASVTRAVGTASPFSDGMTTYTPNGLQQMVKQANGSGTVNLTTYTYDGFDRLSMTSFPKASDGTVSSTTDFSAVTLFNPTTWDATQIRRRDGQLINPVYDARHRVISKDAPASTYTYDNLDRVTSATQGGRTITTAYDALGRVTGTTGPLGSTGYLYDLAGNRIRMTWADGYFVTYANDNTGAVTSILENGSASLASFGYDPLGRRHTLTRANGAVTTYDYDTVSRLASLAITGTTKNETLTLGYNAASQILTRNSTNAAYAWPSLFNVDRGYAINGLNQVTSTTTPTTLTYDGRGNLTSDGATTYVYDIDNRLTSTSSGATMAYDPADRLYQTVSSGGSTTRFAYDGADIIGEYDASGTLLRRYVHGPGEDEPLVAYTGSGTSGNKSWLVADNQGSIVAMTDGSGNATTQSYDDYGIPGPAQTSRFQYTGQVFLPDLGLYYYKARIYSQMLGRFLQSDPIGYGDGLNMYAYVGDDPINGTDPTGLTEDSTLPLTVVGHRFPQPSQEFRQLIDRGVREANAAVNEIASITVTAERKAKQGACAAVAKLGDRGRLRLGADAAGGVGSFGKVGFGISLRGDGSLEGDLYGGLGLGGGIYGGAGVGVDNAGGAARGGHLSGGLEASIAGGVPVIGPVGVGGSATVPVKLSGQLVPTFDKAQVGGGLGVGPRYGLAGGIAATVNATYRTPGLCK